MKLLFLALCLANLYSTEKESTIVTTHHTTCDINYTAHTGTYTLKTPEGGPKADLFFVAYTKDDEDQSIRPITFCFNGGPGSSAIWLHMSAFGPCRVKMEDLKDQSAPFSLEPNPNSLLDKTDLVFIDPVSTGHSRAVKDQDEKQFHGIQEDIDWIAEFIRLYVTKNGRWTSPKYLAGESYGTTRAAGVVECLQSRHNMSFNGVILLSTALNFRTFLLESDGNDLPFMLFLPTYTATAWYHQKLPPDLQEKSLEDAIACSKAFAYSEYALALMQGDELSEARSNLIAQKLSELTGLSAKKIKKLNLRIRPNDFQNKFLGDHKKRLGRMDGRVVGRRLDVGRRYTDPSTNTVIHALTGGLNQYLKHDLKWAQEKEYQILADVFPWKAHLDYGYPSTHQRLANAMQQNPNLRVFIASGYYDMATPFAAAEYTVNQMGLDKELRKNATFGYYPAGHMMYFHPLSHAKLKADLDQFLSW